MGAKTEFHADESLRRFGEAIGLVVDIKYFRGG
jgi:hypothetical protein